MNKNLLAYQLLARLKILTLVGYENGEYIFMGRHSDFSKIPFEEESILRDFELKKLKKNHPEKYEAMFETVGGDFTGCGWDNDR